ncbi:MAG TPA: hypothetical protein VKU81_04365 [Casimicrobiaceae bacterium]|jgi:hypothetical protein|nr:hypothetical protein [Casimicrobiaceae bacterium]
MRRTDRSLDEEIAEVENRLARHREQLRLIAADVRSRISLTSAAPVAIVTALAVGFAASRFVRKPAKPAPMPRGSRSTRLVGALAAALLPRLIRPLQQAAATWLAQRMHRTAAR